MKEIKVQITGYKRAINKVRPYQYTEFTVRPIEIVPEFDFSKNYKLVEAVPEYIDTDMIYKTTIKTLSNGVYGGVHLPTKLTPLKFPDSELVKGYCENDVKQISKLKTSTTYGVFGKREIEFRGASKSTGNFVYGTLINYRDKEYYILTDDEINNGLDFDFLDCCEVIQVYPESVGQYTGLKDKNGVKIFEGDIVKCGKKIAVVKYGYHNCGCCHDVYGFTLIDSCGVTDAFGFYNCEVIGNIYENPELLNGN